jgi:hypothetical protein
LSVLAILDCRAVLIADVPIWQNRKRLEGLYEVANGGASPHGTLGLAGFSGADFGASVLKTQSN